jgi:hypothetical protein
MSSVRKPTETLQRALRDNPDVPRQLRKVPLVELHRVLSTHLPRLPPEFRAAWREQEHKSCIEATITLLTDPNDNPDVHVLAALADYQLHEERERIATELWWRATTAMACWYGMILGLTSYTGPENRALPIAMAVGLLLYWEVTDPSRAVVQSVCASLFRAALVVALMV